MAKKRHHASHRAHHASHRAHHASHRTHHVRHSRRAAQADQNMNQGMNLGIDDVFNDVVDMVDNTFTKAEREIEHSFIAASMLMVVLGLLYFIVNLWIVKFGSGFMGFATDSNLAVFSASLLTVAGLVGGSMVRKMF